MERQRRELILHGFDVPDSPGSLRGGRGNSAWANAQRLSLSVNAQARRN